MKPRHREGAGESGKGGIAGGEPATGRFCILAYEIIASSGIGKPYIEYLCPIPADSSRTDRRRRRHAVLRVNISERTVALPGTARRLF